MNRPGLSILELLVAITLGTILAAVLGGALAAQLRLARLAAERSASADALRTAASVITGEIRRTTAADVRLVAADSVVLRAFRGLARPCSRESDRVLVLYRGDRLPDAGKDSILIIDGRGLESGLAIIDVRYQAVPCSAAPDEVGLRLQLSATVPPGAGLVFESGSYHISGRAVRYRLGAAGRQPLTAELIAAGSGFAAGPAGLRFHLRTSRGDVVTGTAAFAPP